MPLPSPDTSSSSTSSSSSSSSSSLSYPLTLTSSVPHQAPSPAPMDPLSVPISPTTPLSPTTLVTPDDEALRIPELNDSDYFSRVLRLPADKSEVESDNELVTRANAIGIAATLPSVASRRHTSSAFSYSTCATYQDRTFSTTSNGSASTVLTPHSPIFGPPSPILDLSDACERRGSTNSTSSLTFSQYEQYIATVESSLDQPKFLSAPPASDGSTPSVFSVSTKKSLGGGFRSRIRWRKKAAQPLDLTPSCIVCSDTVARSGPLHNLPCNHTYCSRCLKDIISQSSTHESRMPPRCCSQAIPAPTVRAVLTDNDQETFLLAVVKFSTPWEERVFCPDKACGEFIPPQDMLDPKHPFDLGCIKCDGRLCVMCKEAAHPVGNDCPRDWELSAMNRLDDGSSWKRCYQCRSLVELVNESAHATCKCKAQFCSLCAGIWDPTTGCPNLCNFEEELERRRVDGEDRKAQAEAAVSETERRSRANSTIQRLGERQQDELRRFLDYKAQCKAYLESRHSTQKAAIVEKYAHQEEKMKERHERIVAQLEDRQIAAELELRTSLDQSERSVRLRLKHMEAYCDGLGRNPNSTAPARVVTERDLRELGQQYNLRDGMDRMHQSKINVMRERQAKQMEELLDRQETELESLLDKRQDELDKLTAQFSREQAVLADVFEARQSRMHPRWVLAIEVLCKELEEQTGQTFARIAPPRWPEQKESEPEPESPQESEQDDTLATIVGESLMDTLNSIA